MSTNIVTTIVTASMPLDVADGGFVANCVGPSGTTFATQTLPPGTGMVEFSLAGAALPPGTYTVTVMSVDNVGNPAVSAGVAYPKVSASTTVASDLTGPVVTSLGIALS